MVNPMIAMRVVVVGFHLIGSISGQHPDKVSIWSRPNKTKACFSFYDLLKRTKQGRAAKALVSKVILDATPTEKVELYRFSGTVNVITNNHL